jgi:hypothetical protein
MNHTLPKLEGLLDKLSQVDPIAISSLIKETKATIVVIKYTSALLFIIFALTIFLLRDNCYAIVGTGLGDNGVPVHRLSKTSKGPNGELLTKGLPLGPKNSVDS